MNFNSLEPIESVYLRLCQLIILAGIFLIPLFFLPWTTDVLEFNKQFLLIGLAGAALTLWLLHVVVSGQLLWRSNPVDAAMGAVLAAFVLATLFSLTRFKSLFGLTGSLSESLTTMVALSVFYFVAVHSFQDKGKTAKLFMVLSLSLALLFGLMQLFGAHILAFIGAFGFTQAKAFNSLGSLNSLGLLGAAFLPMFYQFNSEHQLVTYFGRAGALFTLVLLVVLNWWILWLVAIAGLVSLIALESVNNESRSMNNETGRRFRMARFVFPMTIIVLGVFLTVVNFDITAAKRDLPVEVAPSFGLSADVVTQTLKKSPAFGYGPENFSLAFDRHGASRLSDTTLSSARFFDSTSQIFNFAVHGGLVLLGALAFLLWILGASIVKRFKQTDHQEHVDTISVLVALVVAMFLYPFNLTLMFLFYVVIALTVLVLWSQAKVVDVEERASLSLVSSLGFIGGLILVLVGFYFSTTIYISDIKYVQALTSQDNDRAVELVVEAINWNGNDDRYYRAASQVALNLLEEEINMQPANEDGAERAQNFISSAISLARRATEIAPRESHNWENLGFVYQNLLGFVEGIEGLAEEAYLRAADLRPGDASYYNQIGSMYLASADFSRQVASAGGENAAAFQQAVVPALEKAEQNFKMATEISNNFGLAIYNLGAVYDRQGKLREAISQLETIMPFNSNQPGLAFELGLLYYRDNQKDKAFNELQRAVLLSPDFANARWYLALIYEERQEIQAAIEQLERILATEANMDNEVVLTKIDDLRSGRIVIPPPSAIDQQPLE